MFNPIVRAIVVLVILLLVVVALGFCTYAGLTALRVAPKLAIAISTLFVLLVGGGVIAFFMR